MWDVHWIVARVKQEKGIVLFGFLFIILWLKYEKTEIKFSRHPYNILNISIYTLFYGNYPNALKAIYEGEINTHI